MGMPAGELTVFVRQRGHVPRGNYCAAVSTTSLSNLQRTTMNTGKQEMPLLSRRALTKYLFGALISPASRRANASASQAPPGLFDPQPLGSLQLPNRMVMAPMTRG